MRIYQSQILYSPSDLVRFMDSPFASWMERLHFEDPSMAQPDEVSDEDALVARTGDQHENRFLQRLRDGGRDIVEIPKDDFETALEQTRRALEDKRGVIYQGALTSGHFGGFTDFIVRDDQGNYEIWDTKLARHTKSYHIIQLCCYAEMLSEVLGSRPEIIRVVLGDQSLQSYRTDDFFHSYLQLKEAFLGQMASFAVDREPPQPDPRADHRRWASLADEWIIQRDHLVQVVGINLSQIRKLESSGIDTLRKLAESTLNRIPKLKDEIFLRLRDQARIQLRAKECEPNDPPPFEILPHGHGSPRTGLALLPPASPGDVYFDIEGYPLENDGLEYLLGASFRENGELVFKDWWAHDEAQEKVAFEDFVDWIHARWRAHPDMHAYHYASYEVTAMKRLMGKYSTREREVDDFLRSGLFVDLYRVVRQGVLLGASSYSLKKVERLYLPQREGDVKDAGASIVYYAQWMESGEPGDWDHSPILKTIRDYNEVDCVSTLRLADWLREKQAEQGVSWAGSCDEPADDPEETGTNRAPTPAELLASRILARLTADGEEREIGELLAHLLEFHRRDDKPMWWAMFERAAMTVEERYDDISCLAGLTLEGVPIPEKRSKIASYTFDPSQETKIHGNSKVLVAQSTAAKPSIVSFDPEGSIELKMSTKALDEKLGGRFPTRLCLIPSEYVSSQVITQALLEIVSRWADGGGLPGCLRRLILRQRPQLVGLSDGTPLKDLAVVLPAMRGSTLAIQGPPGTGKTFTASRLIKALIESGKRVGITSNSHKAILNLLSGVHKAGADLSGSVYAPSQDDETPDVPPGVSTSPSKDAFALYRKGVIAGTAWLFSREEAADSLDYLFVDEAGQVSLANVAAMSRATDNLVLLGDQNQLPMPTQGTHPGESGCSSLVYLLKGHAVVPPELGVFLESTYRMHPEVCGFVSESFYEGKLHWAPGTANQRVSSLAATGPVPLEAGIHFHAVPHIGNTQASDEEVAAIVEILDSLLGREFTDRNGVTRPLELSDVLFVAPYNMQVRHLERALPVGAKVGSVDRFQGQEAPVVIVSLCSSAGEYGSRGLSFILDRNRLNVALSRAQALAIVVADPAIACTPANSIKELQLLNTFCRLVQSH